MAHRFEDYGGGEVPWLDRPGARAEIERRLAAGELTPEAAERLRTWERDGYVVIPGLLPHGIADRINADVQAIHDEYRHQPLEELRERFKNAYHRSAATREALVLPEVLSILDELLGARMLPHQTLNLPVSSQQAAHSDQILMTTHPLGYMAAVWFALEDVDEECGPLIVYPRSHRLPFVHAGTIGLPREAGEAERNRIYDATYYGRIAALVAEHGLEPWTFLPRKGDVLIWHANLLHGARLVEREGATRRSLIAHYFAEGTEHYSDLYGWACISPQLRDTEPHRSYPLGGRGERTG